MADVTVRLRDRTAGALEAALGDHAVVARYRAKVVHIAGHRCLWWTGAVTTKGHGRFWLGPDTTGDQAGFVVSAHRFGYALEYGFDALTAAPAVAHDVCDNPLCQEPSHLVAMTGAQNTANWATRRHTLGGVFRDRRGARERALAVRAALRAGVSPEAALMAGIPQVERDQLTLW